MWVLAGQGGRNKKRGTNVGFERSSAGREGGGSEVKED